VEGKRVLFPLQLGTLVSGDLTVEKRIKGQLRSTSRTEAWIGRPAGTSFSTLSTVARKINEKDYTTRSQAVARIAYRTAKNCRGHVT